MLKFSGISSKLAQKCTFHLNPFSSLLWETLATKETAHDPSLFPQRLKLQPTLRNVLTTPINVGTKIDRFLMVLCLPSRHEKLEKASEDPTTTSVHWPKRKPDGQTIRMGYQDFQSVRFHVRKMFIGLLRSPAQPPAVSHKEWLR